MRLDAEAAMAGAKRIGWRGCLGAAALLWTAASSAAPHAVQAQAGAAPVGPAVAPPPAEPDFAAQSRALERAARSVFSLRARAVEGARSARTLGAQREGSGVLISADGLVLTIGYLVMEAEEVDLVDDEGRRFPARVVGLDLATGFGLVQALAPLARQPAPLGQPGTLAAGAPLFVMSGGEDGDVSAARLLARRPFAGYWEYRIDGALYTAPARRDHAGAALFSPQGELLGIGSLLMPDAAAAASAAARAGDGAPPAPAAPAARTPGNLFVPVDLLVPVLGELRASGTSRASARAWLGLNCIERDGEVRIVRVADDSPADVAGLAAGDRIVAIDGTPVAALDELWQRLWAGATPERAVALDIVRGNTPQRVVVQAVDRAKTLARPRGI